MFFSLAFLLRLVTSFGGSSYLTACFTLIAIDFPDRISTFFVSINNSFLTYRNLNGSFIIGHDRDVLWTGNDCRPIDGRILLRGEEISGLNQPQLTTLYQLGGFSLPFFVTSVLTLLATAFSYFTLETKEVKQEKKSEIPENEKVTMWKLISTFSIFINIFINFTTFVNIGFMDATLEHHIRDVSN